MEKRNKVANILIAVMLSVVLLVTFLAFRSGGTTSVAAASTSQTAVVELDGEAEADIAGLQAQIASLQAENEELRSAVSTLQDRESQYQSQIELANQTIDELSAQNGILAGGLGGDDGLLQRPERHSH